jgi:DNA-binding response OmpR family regulator
MARVLALDEEAPLLDLIELVVQRLGHDFVGLGSKRAALDHLRGGDDGAPVQAEPADVILVDGAFTDSDHAEVLAAIAELQTEPAVVLILSPWDAAEPDPRLAELPVSRVLHKPLDIAVLERDLAELTATAVRPLGHADTLRSEELRGRYRKSLQAVRASLDDALSRGQGPSDVRRTLSRVAGIAGSYGYLNLSAQARVALAAASDNDDSRPVLDELNWLLGAALASPPPPLTRAPTSLGPLRWPGSALVVGDDPELVTRVGAELAAHGVDLRFSPTVDEAVELAEGYLPDLIVADARLAEHSVDGFPIDEELREGFARAIPMVLLGVADDAHERVRAANAGVTVFAALDEEGAVLRAAQALAPESYLGVPVIIVDDDPDITDLVTGLLMPFGVYVHVAHTPAQLFELLEQVRPALVLLDIQLPGYGGHQLCRTLKAEPRWRDISIVYLTADGRPETKVQAFNNGADDFLVKPVVPQELVAKVLSKLRFQQLAFQRQMRDALTGALSRQGVEQRAAALMTQTSRPAGCGLCLVEVEHLTAIVQEAGLLTAERALREAAEALGGAFLGRDSVGRWGPIDPDQGHFLVLTLGGAPMAFQSAHERIKRHLAEHPVFGPDGYFHQLTLSLGATALQSRDTLPVALDRAQKALSRARQNKPSLVVD